MDLVLGDRRQRLTHVRTGSGAQYTADGTSVWTNLALACVQCNKRKSDRTPQEAGLTLRQKPVEPNQFDPRFNFRLHIHALRPEWSDYKAYIYWNVGLEK